MLPGVGALKGDCIQVETEERKRGLADAANDCNIKKESSWQAQPGRHGAPEVRDCILVEPEEQQRGLACGANDLQHQEGVVEADAAA